jgi:hypothetical protein
MHASPLHTFMNRHIIKNLIGFFLTTAGWKLHIFSPVIFYKDFSNFVSTINANFPVKLVRIPPRQSFCFLRSYVNRQEIFNIFYTKTYKITS